MDEFDDSEGFTGFDTKKFLFRVLSYWKVILLLLLIGVFFVYQKNIREEFSYRLSTKISIEDDSNPLFTSNASLTFNWGGVTSKLQTVIVTLKSRSHHEKVVERLEFYKSYLKQGRFAKKDIYKEAPFRFDHSFNENQILNIPIKITFLGNNELELELEFLNENVLVQSFLTKKVNNTNVSLGVFKKKFIIGEAIALPFLNGSFRLLDNIKPTIGATYFLQFNSFDNAVSSYQARTGVSNSIGSPILDISLIDKNTHKIVDYLNTLVEVLSEDQLDRKNLYATNAIAFIEQQISRVKKELNTNAKDLNDYRKKNKVFSLNEEGVVLNEKLTKVDEEKELINRQLQYYSSLRDYLETSSSFTDIPAPSIAGISDGNILKNVSKINTLSVEKSKLQYSVRSNTSIFNDLNREIDGLKSVLIENINAASNILKKELVTVNSSLKILEAKFNKLPEDQQNVIAIERQYNLSEQTYNVFLSKRGEAEIIKASNVSDILIIDSAKNTGATKLGRNLNIRYLFALLFALLIPALLAFILTLLDKNIHSPLDLEKVSKIPLLGVVGKNKLKTNLVVREQSKSSVAESFRSIRSNLQYYFKTKDKDKAKVIMLTSSVSGEGKTFCSMNLATVFSLSGKKTVLLGLDLRKPKIVDDFGIENNIGVVNYLIDDIKLDDIIFSTENECFDVIPSGPIPPNPSELLLGDKLKELIENLKIKYDYIVLDTPPVGLVSDALELVDYTDAFLYVVRQDYTKKGMLNFINDKYKNKQIKNISLIYNSYDQKANYGYGYGYGYEYGYGYGNYANGYYEEDREEVGFFSKIKSYFRK